LAKVDTERLFPFSESWPLRSWSLPETETLQYVDKLRRSRRLLHQFVEVLRIRQVLQVAGDGDNRSSRIRVLARADHSCNVLPIDLRELEFHQDNINCKGTLAKVRITMGEHFTFDFAHSITHRFGAILYHDGATLQLLQKSLHHHPRNRVILANYTKVSVRAAG
jgi:hypothetical protein